MAQGKSALLDFDAMGTAAMAVLLAPDVGAEDSGFSEWLFTKAQTEDGPFPDWPYLRDFASALESGGDLVVLKRRQILVSWVVAAYWHYRASRNPYHHGAVVSSGLRASSKQGRRIRVIAANDGYHGLGTTLLTYPNGSEISILPSTETAGVGDSLKLGVHFDEFAFHRYAQANLDTIRPAVANSGGQTVITSTANPLMGATGPFVDVWDASPEEQKRFYGRWCRPDQGPAFFAAEAKKPGMSAKTLQAWYPEHPEDAFIAHQGLVLPEFGNIHIGEPLQSWSQCKFRVAGADPGGGDHTAMLLVGVPHDESAIQVYSPAYYHAGGTSIDEYAEFYSKADRVGKVQAFVIGETGGTSIVTTLRRMGIRAERAALKPDENREFIRWALENNLLRVDPKLTDLIQEFRLWRWKPGTDEWTRETVMTSVGGKRHHDLMDCLGYALARIIRQLRDARPVLIEQRKALPPNPR